MRCTHSFTNPKSRSKPRTTGFTILAQTLAELIPKHANQGLDEELANKIDLDVGQAYHNYLQPRLVSTTRANQVSALMRHLKGTFGEEEATKIVLSALKARKDCTNIVEKVEKAMSVQMPLISDPEVDPEVEPDRKKDIWLCRRDGWEVGWGCCKGVLKKDNSALKIASVVVGVIAIGLICLIIGYTTSSDKAENTKPNSVLEKTSFIHQNISSCEDQISNTLLMNGRLSCDNHMVKVICDDGFRPAKLQEVDFSKLLEVVASLQCKQKTCSTPSHPENGRLVDCNKPAVGSSCKVECNHGPAQANNVWITCQADLNWSEMPTCLQPPCSSLDNSTGSVACTADGQTCLARCPDGGLTQLSRCGADGRWDGSLSSKTCGPACKLPASDDGFILCGGTQLSDLMDSEGVPSNTECTLICSPGCRLFGLQTTTCDSDGHWTEEFGACEKTVMVLAGGEENGQVVSTVEVFSAAQNMFTDCLPPLPEPVKWSSMGFIKDSLLHCGGERNAFQSSTCWILHANSSKWEEHSSLSNPRSQAATTVSLDDKLVLFSSYSSFRHNGHHALTSMQKVGVSGPENEQQLRVKTSPYSSRLASAVSLTSGEVLIAGGKTKEKKVFLVRGAQLENWVTCKDMLHERFGHAGAKVLVARQEEVLMAGGWNSQGEVQDSVELYSLQRDSWRLVPSMPSPRVNFMLKVIKSEVMAVGGSSLKVYPRAAVMTHSEEGGWTQWREVAGQRATVKRESFSFADVPLSWMEKKCTAK